VLGALLAISVFLALVILWSSAPALVTSDSAWLTGGTSDVGPPMATSPLAPAPVEGSGAAAASARILASLNAMEAHLSALDARVAAAEADYGHKGVTVAGAQDPVSIMGGDGRALGAPTLASAVVVPRSSASDAAALDSPSLIGGGVRALATPALAFGAESTMGAQVAALQQQVTAMLSLMASEQQRAVAQGSTQFPQVPTPAPTVAPPPWAWPTRAPAPLWDSAQKLEEIKKQMKNDAEVAAKAKLQPEIDKLTKAVERLSEQANDRYAKLLEDHAVTPAADYAASDNITTAIDPAETAMQEAGHGCRSPPCSRDLSSCKLNRNCCIDLMFEMLVDFSEFLNRRNVTHFLVAGSLIGGVRDHDIIPSTSDVDMVIPREGWKIVKEINHERSRARSYFFMEDPDDHHCARLCAAWKGLPVNRKSFLSHFDWDTDAYGADIQYYMDIYDENMDFAEKLKHLHYPLTNVTIRNKTFPAPREPELWVEARYGPSWRIPDHKSRLTNDAGYPTIDEARSWSDGMLTLRKARTDAVLGHRLLERATVNHKTGNVEIADVGVSPHPPSSKPKTVIVEGLRARPGGAVENGTVVVWPPTENEGEITHYVVYWAADRVKGWDVVPERLGNAIMSAFRCGGGDPFKACYVFGQPLRVVLPRNATLPAGATDILVVCANEAGESTSEGTIGTIFSDTAGADSLFSRRAKLGILGGLAPDATALANCVDGRDSSLKRSDLEEHVVNEMLRRTVDNMKHAIFQLADWLWPVADTLETCNETAANVTRQQLLQMFDHMKTPTNFNYEPGKALDIDGHTILRGVNNAIVQLRKDMPAAFGRAVGEMMLKPLGTMATTNFASGERHRQQHHDEEEEVDGEEDEEEEEDEDEEEDGEAAEPW